jgi:hypothetical protein
VRELEASLPWPLAERETVLLLRRGVDLLDFLPGVDLVDWTPSPLSTSVARTTGACKQTHSCACRMPSTRSMAT